MIARMATQKPKKTKVPEISDRVTFRLLDLREPLESKLADTGESVTEYFRRVVSEDLGVSNVEAKPGWRLGQKRKAE